MPGDDRMWLYRTRTMLAWERSALSLMVVGLLFVRTIGPPYLRLAHVVGLVITAVGVVLLVWSRRRGSQITTPAAIAAATGPIRVVALGTVGGGAAILGVVVVRLLT